MMADDFQVPCKWIFSQSPTAEEPVMGSVALSSAQLTREAPAHCFKSNFGRPKHVCLSKPAIVSAIIERGGKGGCGAHSSPSPRQ